MTTVGLIRDQALPRSVAMKDDRPNVMPSPQAQARPDHRNDEKKANHSGVCKTFHALLLGLCSYLYNVSIYSV